MALEAGVVCEGVLLGADEVAGAEEWRQQLGGRSERLVYRKSAERLSVRASKRDQKDGVINWTADP